MRRFLLALGLGFLAALCGYLHETLSIYFDNLAHQPGKVPVSQQYSFPPSDAFSQASPLWVPLWFAITAVVWTVWTLIVRNTKDVAFPVRILIAYLLCVSSLPTLSVLGDFGNLEATEEDWNWVIGWSYLLIGPVLAACYLALRNFRHMPVLATFTALFALFHIITTILDYGVTPRYVLDFEPEGSVNLDIVYYLRFCAALAVPFLFVYGLWKFLPLKISRVVLTSP